MKRILIFGAGAVGTLLGGLLSKAGHKVVFIGRPWNIDGVVSKGIDISGVWGAHTVGPQPAYTHPGDIPEAHKNFDWIIITTKAFSTIEAVNICSPLVGENTFVISCQNGYGNSSIIAQKIGWEHTLSARFITGVELPEPGKVNVTVHADDVRIGHYIHQVSMKPIEEIAGIMHDAEIPIEATDQVEQYIWAKILYNAALNPMGALLGVTYGELAEQSDTRKIMDNIMDEAFSVTSAHEIRQFWTNADAYREAFYKIMIPPTAAHFPSMLRDIQRGKRTEIDALNGAICNLGKAKGIPTPVNDTITGLIRFREKM